MCPAFLQASIHIASQSGSVVIIFYSGVCTSRGRTQWSKKLQRVAPSLWSFYLNCNRDIAGLAADKTDFWNCYFPCQCVLGGGDCPRVISSYHDISWLLARESFGTWPNSGNNCEVLYSSHDPSHHCENIASIEGIHSRVNRGWGRFSNRAATCGFGQPRLISILARTGKVT